MILQKRLVIVTDIFEGAKEKFNKFVKLYSRASALALAGKVFMVMVFFSAIPFGTLQTQSYDFETDLKLNKESGAVLEAQNKIVQLEVGESNQAKADREAKQKEIKVLSVASLAHYEPVSYTDPAEFRPVYVAAAAQFGIPWQILEAVHQVESGKSGSTTTRSYAGAQGPMQFMPGTWRAYGVDGNGDGLVDANNVVDAIYGAAHLLARSGADEGRIDDALFNYNHAQWYVTKVKTIAYEIGLP